MGGVRRTPHLNLVARVSPDGPTLFKHPDLAREFALLSTLAEHTDIRVPRVRWYEEDSSVLGGPFIVMDHVAGEVPADDPPYVAEGWVLDLDPPRRGLVYENTLQVIARLHSVEWKALGLQYLARSAFGEPGIDQQLAELHDFYQWAREGQNSPTIDAAFAWLQARKPTGEDLVLNWGDARIANVIFHPRTVDVQAVLDWEMATIASPEMDLGWLVFFVRFVTEGSGAEIPEGMQTPQELIARYEQITGRVVHHIAYYEALAALRTSVYLLRMGHLLIAGGGLPASSPMPVNNPASQLLAKMLGLPAPAGESVHFLEGR